MKAPKYLFFALLLLSISNHTFSQKVKGDIDLFFISCWGDSLFPQGYELHIKSKQVYFINPVMNYLDIKDGKPKYLMVYTEEKTTKIFNCLNKVDISNLSEYIGSGNDTKKFTVRLIFTDNQTQEYIIPDKQLPEDLKVFYKMLIE